MYRVVEPQKWADVLNKSLKSTVKQRYIALSGISYEYSTDRNFPILAKSAQYPKSSYRKTHRDDIAYFY